MTEAWPAPHRLRAVLLALLSLIALLPALAPGAAGAAEVKAVPAEPPAQVRELLQLLDDPQVRGWLEQQRSAAAPAPAPRPSATAIEADLSGLTASRLDQLKQHFGQLAAALPMVPAELARVGTRLGDELAGRGVVSIVLLVLGFVVLGFGAEWVFWRLTRGLRAWISERPMETVRDRVRLVLTRFAFGVALVLVFALGSIGAFLLLDWPPMLREIVLGYLLAFLALRLGQVLGRFLFAPAGGTAFRNVERFRMLPMSDAAARFWYLRLAIVVGWLAFCYVTLQLFVALGVDPPVRRLIAYPLALIWVGIGLEAIWRRPRAEAAVEGRIGQQAMSWLFSLYLVLLWALFVTFAIRLFWLAVFAVCLPALLRLVQRAINHILRPAGATGAAAAVPSLYAVVLERGVRTALIVGAALLLADRLGIDLVALTASDNTATRLVRGVITAAVILLIAEFIWRIIKTAIDQKVAEVSVPGQADTEEGRRRSRLRTLLPIARNLILIVLLVIAALMALSAMGVEIGPLVAGAGVVGVAVGFGAQTLVRDVISGMFYLLDDAFRVGEYIQSGSYKGTVESFSLRSVKLRHHRGPLYTVPFGVLGAVQNMSRDWVIDKLSVGITYDSDIEKARKLIKQIGQDLLKDPELAPNIIEPLKMQGVEQFGDFAIQIRMKMMTKPGEQFVIRRKALGLIKKAFDANGIKFAFPTVQVAGGTSDATAAMAQQALEMTKPHPAPA
ncbi:MAG: mechanosensitive ion channel family protein [Dongiaceae bacterium]